MVDSRTKKLAEIIVNYSIDVKEDENVIIEANVEAKEFIIELYKQILLKRAHPILDINFPETEKIFFEYAKKNHLENFPKHILYSVKIAQKYIYIDTEKDVFSLADVPSEKIILREKILEPIKKEIYSNLNKTKSCIVGFPCKAYAKQAGMSFKEYSDFVFSACLQDWKNITKQSKKILHEFRTGEKISLIGEGVDLSFEIRGKKAEIDDGRENLPGGEIYMAPRKKTLNGWIKFDYPAIENGKEIDGVFLQFKNGKVIKSKAEKNNDYLRKLIKADKNASYIGEFGIGINKKICKFTKNLLFDEKIGGTIHLALGSAYKENGGGNNSVIHIDLIKKMDKGKILLDGKIIQENGIWKI